MIENLLNLKRKTLEIRDDINIHYEGYPVK